jgi:hypothetical protein
LFFSQRPMNSSLRPPPYASAVSKKFTPASKARSISSMACGSVSPMP